MRVKTKEYSKFIILMMMLLSALSPATVYFQAGIFFEAAYAAEPLLIEAVKNYDYDSAEKLIKGGCDIKARSEKGMTPAHQALKIFRDGGGYVMYTWDSEFVLLESGEISIKMARLILENGGECVYADESAFKDSTLSLAAISGDAGLVSLLIKGGADVNYKGANSMTPLILAAITASPEILKILCDAGADINAKLDSGENALTMAMNIKKHANALFLAKRGADVNVPHSLSLWSPLEFAVREGAPLELFEALVKGGANVNYVNPKNKRSVFVYALDYCVSNDIIKLLVDAGADINAASYSGKTPLIAAAASADNIENLKYLLSKGVNVNAKDDSGSDALAVAEANDNKEAVVLLYDAGLKRDSSSRIVLNSLLNKAVMGSDTAEIKMLVSRGASADAPDKYGTPILYECVRLGKTESALALLDKGAKIYNDQPGDYYDALIEAIGKNNSVLINKMVDKIGVDLKSHTAEVYLMRAIDMNSVATVSYLLSRGFDKNQRFVYTKDDKTEECHALAYAAKCSDEYCGVLNTLLSAGADINARDGSGMTALMHAVNKGNRKIVNLLLENKADTNLKDNSGRAAMSLAILGRRQDIIESLKKHGAKYDYSDASANEENLFAALTDKKIKEAAAVVGKAGAGPDTRFKNGKTALIMAAENCDYDMVKLLVEKGADVNATAQGYPDGFLSNYDYYRKDEIKRLEYNALNAVIASEKTGKKIEIIDYLLKNKIKIIPSTIKVDKIIYSDGPESVFKKLADRGLDINTRFYGGNTALMTSFSYRPDSELLKYLIKKGADVNIKNDAGRTALMESAKNGYCDENFTTLLKAGADVNAADNFGDTALIIAFQGNDNPNMNLIEALIAAGAKIDHKNREGFTAAYYAARRGADEQFEKLMEKGASFEGFKNTAKASILRRHIKNNDTAEVKLLLAEGVSPDLTMKENFYGGDSALNYCIVNSRDEIACMLIDKGAVLKHKAAAGRSEDDALCVALSRNNLKIADRIINRLTIERAVNKNYAAGFNGAAAICLAALTGDIDMIKKISSIAGGVNCLDENGNNALQLLCRSYYKWNSAMPAGLNYLMDNGIEINNRENKSGETAIFIAAESGDENMAAELIKKGADINLKNNEGITPLIKSAISEKRGLVEFFIKCGAKIDYEDKKQISALLRYSIFNSGPEQVDFYVKKGLKLTADAEEFHKDHFNTAIKNDRVAAAEVFVKNGFKPDFKGGMNELGVYTAARMGHFNAVKYFIDNGADINAPDSDGETLLMKAAEFQCSALMLYLINAGADVNRVGNKGSSALMTLLDRLEYTGGRSCFHDHVIVDTGLIELMIKKGADVNIKDKEGNTPFKIASQALLRLKRGFGCDKCVSAIKSLVKILKSAGAK